MAYYNRLKEARVAAKMTQQQLAEKIGMAKSTLTNYENGVREPSVHVLGKLMEALDIDPNYLFQDEMIEINDPTILATDEYPLLAKYRRLTSEEKNRIDELIDRTLSGQPISDITTTQKKPAPTNEGELDEAIIDMVLQLHLTPYELQRLVDFAKGLAAARTVPPSEQHQDH